MTTMLIDGGFVIISLSKSNGYFTSFRHTTADDNQTLKQHKCVDVLAYFSLLCLENVNYSYTCCSFTEVKQEIWKRTRIIIIRNRNWKIVRPCKVTKTRKKKNRHAQIRKIYPSGLVLGGSFGDF